jgi:hypothetical protein
VAAEGSRLLSGTLSTEIPRAEAGRLILEGFFPACAPGETPRRAARTALQELGLPYAQDPAITRHLAAFLRQHAAACFSALHDEPGRDALVSSWWPDAPPIGLLPHQSLELAVARGAACYGLARRGLGRRIGGGSAHALYVGLAAAQETSAPRAICLIPRGHEEGQPVDLKSRPFELMLGRPVQFPLFSTTSDRIDRPGAPR